ncbi:MAG: glycosyltransferase family 9 protein [Saprospiraceae bacterium]|nr:glycosyltransferase family 9 protein [Saprospiraceae bacterium]
MPDTSTFHKILVVQTAFIGDVVLATALLEELHRVLPASRIDFLLRKGNEGVLENHPFVGKTLIWDKSKQKHWNLFQIIKAVRLEEYDLLINLQRFFSTGLLTAFGGAKKTVCYDKNPLSRFATDTVPYTSSRLKGEHEVSRLLRLISFLTQSKFSRPGIYPSKKDFDSVRFEEKYLTISPASVWFTKQLPKERWLDFMDRVGEDTTIFLLGGKSDRILCEWLRDTTKHVKTIVKAGELSFLESSALMKSAVMNYTNDSAPLHFASAMDAPVAAVFCSTVPAFGFTPLSSNSNIVETKLQLDCRPCGLHGKKACPQRHFNCSSIQTEQLLERLPQ